MAAIDKTYINNKKDYDDLINWVNTQSTYITSIGESFNIKDYMYEWNEEDVLNAFNNNKEIPIWNTPQVVDKYLYKNCPLKFIQDRLKEQYGNPEELLNKFNNYEYGKCIVKKFPKIFKDVLVEFSVINKSNDCLEFSKSTNKWGNPWDILYISTQYTYGLNIRKLRRLLKTWLIPKGYAVYIKLYNIGVFITNPIRITSFAH